MNFLLFRPTPGFVSPWFTREGSAQGTNFGTRLSILAPQTKPRTVFAHWADGEVIEITLGHAALLRPRGCLVLAYAAPVALFRPCVTATSSSSSGRPS